MLGVIRVGHPGRVSLLDLGCGASHLLEHIHRSGVEGLDYSGLDVSGRFVEVSRRKFPDVEYFHGDLLDPALEVPTFDYVVMNGLFTYRGPLSEPDMVDQWQRLVAAAMQHARVGVVFNTSSPYVDWRRDDLFHASIGTLTDFVARSRFPYFVVRHDYGLFESTVYAYRDPAATTQARG